MKMLKMKIRTLLTVIAGILLLTSCKEVVIKNGRIPATYLQQAKKAEGVFFGSFKEQRAQIKIRFVGDQPLLEYADASGADLIGPSCHSKIGLLKKIYVSERPSGYVLDHAFFDFDPGLCARMYKGRELRLDFTQNYQTIDIALYTHSSMRQVCDGNPSYPTYPTPNPGFPGSTCRWEEVREYDQGEFTRVAPTPVNLDLEMSPK